MKTVLITGSEGFVGQYLWKELESNGYQVYGTTLLVPEAGLVNNVFVCDIEKQDHLSELISKIRPDIIVHLAGQAKPGLSYKIPQKTFSVNTIGTINLFEAIKNISGYTPRIIMIGSSEEYGNVSVKNLPVSERTSVNPTNPYSISKTANWFLSREYVRAFNFDIVYVTPFNHTGPGQSLGFITTDVSSQIVEIEQGKKKPIVLTGDLSSKRDICDVRDVVRGYRLLIEKGRSGERYIICSGESVLVRDIVDKLISFSKVKIELRLDPSRIRPLDAPNMYGSHEKITGETGWTPEIPLEKTLEDILEWRRANS